MSYTPNSNSPLLRAKDRAYFENRRDDIVCVVERHKLKADRVLELGCAGGATGAALKPLLNSSLYVGIDASEDAAKVARARLDHVHVADLNTATPQDLGLQEQQFDLLLAFDVLEHLYDPWDVMARWASLLGPRANVIVSTPNIQNIVAIERLVAGLFEYDIDGLLDATHIRFFTIKSLVDLLTGAGLEIVHVHRIHESHVDPQQLRPQGNSLTMENLTVTNQTREDILRLCTFQYIVLARRPA